jgi:hypothetical protein
MGTMGYANVTSAKQRRSVGAIRPARKIRKESMKISLKQRIRNWIMSDDYEQDIPQTIEADRLSSEGMRLQVYRASGGFVIETRSYDRRKDESVNNMYVITDDKELGAEIGKIITMESLR